MAPIAIGGMQSSFPVIGGLQEIDGLQDDELDTSEVVSGVGSSPVEDDPIVLKPHRVETPSC